MPDGKNKKEALLQKYHARGSQTLSLAEYEAIRAKKTSKKEFRLPGHFKIILSTPLLIVFCFGLLFIPYMIYLIATRPYVGIQDKEKDERQVSTSSPAHKNKDATAPSSAG